MADHPDDLDELLDSALDDFQTLNLTSSSQRVVDKISDDPGNNVKECSSKSPNGNVQGLGMGLPDLKIKKKGKQTVQPSKQQDSHISEALDKLREQTKEAVKGLESVSAPKLPFGDNFGSGSDAMMDDWVKQFEEMAGSQDMESVVETMMQQLLSKEILHEPMKEIAERYPKWLEDNKAKITDEEYARYSHQYDFVKDLNRVYETEPENFNKIVELMQKMQDCGQPPKDIVEELAPDISNLGQLSPELFESQQNCCIM